MSNWLARMFTIPRKKREELAKLPGVTELAQHVKDLAVSVAQGVVDEHVSDEADAEKLKDAIAQQIDHAIPTSSPSAAETAATAKPFTPGAFVNQPIISALPDAITPVPPTAEVGMPSARA